MSDHGEKTCPLCAEEMDLTDQQLKPCKCGYEICVWCWHHVMDMAEKDDTEGRCPACRVPYDKEKIVAMADNCGRLVAEISMEKKVKSQKTKLKSSEGRKQLSSVRVIQRNLVYIVGLPLDLGDEDLLQHKEYFGQYGKVLKVSMSRAASGVIQQFPNNTCSVYITYSKEDEAIRCIQSVHGFVLDGRPLRACFGTTKYCHAWLRNMPCSNPDCLYLHEIGSQEDSFTKDEVVSAYTRNWVQHITGATNSLQRCAGSVLPPPVDDYSINSILPSVKSAVVNASNNSTNVVRVSPPNSSSGRSAGLPPGASWGTRASNCQPPATNSASIDGSIKPKPETVGGSLVYSSSFAITAQASKKLNQNGQTVQDKGTVDSSVKHFINSEKHFTPDQTPLHSILAVKSDSEGASVSSRTTRSPDDLSSGNAMDKDLNGSKSDKLQDLCADMSQIGINRDLRNKHPSSHIRPGALLPDSSNKLPDKQEQAETEALTLDTDRRSSISSDGFLEHHGGTADSHVHAIPKMLSDVDEDVQLFNDQRLKDTEVVSRPSYLLPSLNDSLRISSYPVEFAMHHREGPGTKNFDIDPSFVNSNAHEGALLPASSLVSPNGYSKNSVIGSGYFDRAVDNSFLFPHEENVNQMGCIQGHPASLDCSVPMDMGESSIISNILSMDFDADDSLTSPQNLAKLLGETKQNGTITSSWKAHNANQSRFSFARQDTNNQLYKDPPGINVEKVQRQSSFNHSLFNGGDTYFDNGFSSGGFGPLNSSGNQACVQSNKISASRSQISAPPGFSVPNRAPPPGFSSHERMDQIFDSFSGNQLLDTSSLLRNTYNGPSSVNMTSTGDIEFMDPAILAVGKGRLQGGFNNPSLDMRSNFPAQFSAFENEAKLQLLMQRSLSSQQNLRLTDMGNGFSSIHDTYGIHPRVNDQSQASNHSPFSQLSIQQTRSGLLSNGHSDGWNDVQNGNNLGMADVLRNERLGFNKFYSGFEDSKFRMPSSGNLYNRTYGM